MKRILCALLSALLLLTLTACGGKKPAEDPSAVSYTHLTLPTKA